MFTCSAHFFFIHVWTHTFYSDSKLNYIDIFLKFSTCWRYINLYRVFWREIKYLFSVFMNRELYVVRYIARREGGTHAHCKSQPLRSPSVLWKWMFSVRMSYFHIWHRITFEKCRHKYRSARVQLHEYSMGALRQRPPCIYLINSGVV